MKTTGELLVEKMSEAERERAERVEAVLPVLREHAEEADLKCEFYSEPPKTCIS